MLTRQKLSLWTARLCWPLVLPAFTLAGCATYSMMPTPMLYTGAQAKTLFTDVPTWHRQSVTPTHELQRLGGWRTSVMVERYAHLAPDHLAKAANRLDSLLGGYDLATLEKRKGVREER